MSEYIDIERDMYSKDKSTHIETDEKDLEKYIDKVTKSFRKARQDHWWKQYKINYLNRHPDQVEKRKSDLD